MSMRKTLLRAELAVMAVLLLGLVHLWASQSSKHHQTNIQLVSATTGPATPTTKMAWLAPGIPLPGPTNTGPTNPSILKPSGSFTVRNAGAVIENLAITGWVEISAPNVTIQNCTVDGGGTIAIPIQLNAGANNCVIKDTTIFNTGPAGEAVCDYANDNQFLRMNIYNTASQAFHLGGASIVQGCWLHRIGWNAAGIKSNPTHSNFNSSDHVDDFFIETGTSFTITGNNIDTPWMTVINGVTYGTAAVFFFDPYDKGDSIGPTTISHNFLNGGGYMFNLFGKGPYTITNNIIGPDEQYKGFIYPAFIGGQWNWEGNLSRFGFKIFAPRGLHVSPTSMPTRGQN